VTALSRRVGISIPTCDRWDDLEVTLTSLHAHGYSALETIVIDDGSVMPQPAGFAERFPWARFIRSEERKGVCFQRNRLARLLSTPLVLSLDDDSFPVAGSLPEACDWLEARPEVMALTFQIVLRDQNLPAGASAQAPFLVRHFINCATLMKRQILQDAGGYDAGCPFYLEEIDLSLRAFQRGYEVRCYPAFVVRHHLSPAGRNQAQRTELLLRMETLFGLLYLPFPEFLLRLLICIPGFLVKNPECRPYPHRMLAGVFRGVGDALSGRFPRTRLTRSQYRTWKQRSAPPQGVAAERSGGNPS
jgi:GT2 family glycosyltransferase